MDENEFNIEDDRGDKSSILKESKRMKKSGMWFVVLFVYLGIFSYIAFWPMKFNNPEHTIEKYFNIAQEYSGKYESSEEENHFRNTISGLIVAAQKESSNMQKLASQSFNIILGGFLAFLSATITTIFQDKK